MNKINKRIRPHLLYPLIFFFILLIHITYIANDFTWLDRGDILEGRSILELQQLPLMMVIRFAGTAFYRPLVTFFNSFDFSLYKSFAPGFHTTNILLHLFVIAIVPLFISAFFKFSRLQKVLVMVIVGIHPLTWLPVGAISYRPELLVTIFTLLTVYFHAKARLTKNELFRFLTIVSFFLALLSKETAIFIIPALIFFWEFLYKRSIRQTTKQHHYKEISWNWSLYISEIIVFIIYIAYRFRAVPEVWKSTPVPLSFSQAIGTHLEVLLKLFIDFINPLKPSLSDAVSIVGAFSIYSILTILILAFIVISIIKTGIRSSIGKALALWLILLLPSLNIVPVPRIGSPHYGYLPLVAFGVLIVLLFTFIYKKSKKGSIFCLVSWVLIMSISTFYGGFQFKNDQTLFQPEVKSHPEFLEGYFYLGNYFLRQQKYNMAEKQYFMALKKDPKFLAYTEEQSIYINLSTIYLQTNQLKKAEDALSKAELLFAYQNSRVLYHNRIILAYKKHDYKNVINLSQDDKSFPYTPSIYIMLADSMHHVGWDDQAIQALQLALPLVNKAEQQKIKTQIKSIQKKYNY